MMKMFFFAHYFTICTILLYIMYVYARKVVKNNNDDALRFFFYQMSECSPELSEEYEVAQLFFNPLCSDAVRVQFLPTFNRMVHSEEAVETDIGAVFALRKQKNPTLFDGSKFRFHSCTSSSGDAASAGGAGSEVAVLSLGLTSYGTFLGTNYGRIQQRLREDGIQEHGNPQAFFSDPLGVGAMLRTKDNVYICIERSQTVGEFAGYIDGPGGHPEPGKIGIALDYLTQCDPGRYADVGDEVRCQLDDGNVEKIAKSAVVAELFDSITSEVCDEINVPRESLSDPLLMGIARQTASFGRPALSFYIECKLDRKEVLELYKEGPAEADESVKLLFLPASVLAEAGGTGYKGDLKLTPALKAAVYILGKTAMG